MIKSFEILRWRLQFSSATCATRFRPWYTFFRRNEQISSAYFYDATRQSENQFSIDPFFPLDILAHSFAPQNVTVSLSFYKKPAAATVSVSHFRYK
jgi:hypothetical protein